MSAEVYKCFALAVVLVLLTLVAGIATAGIAFRDRAAAQAENERLTTQVEWLSHDCDCP